MSRLDQHVLRAADLEKEVNQEYVAKGDKSPEEQEKEKLKNDLEQAEKRANNIVTATAAAVNKFFPYVLFPEDFVENGTEVLAPVVEHHMNGEMPQWMESILRYKYLGEAAWFFGVFGVSVVTQIKAKKAKDDEDEEKQNTKSHQVREND